MSVIAKCDSCKKEFDIDVQSRPIGKHNDEMVTQHYFACPSCSHEYHTFFETPKIKRLKQEITTLRGRLSKTSTQAEAEKIVRKQERATAEILRISEGIKAAIQKG